MTVDVIVPNWNGAAYLEACLEALRRQHLLPSRVIVVDNGSSDTSQEVVARFGAEWLPLGRNAGFPAAANAGIEASTAEFIGLLNNDAIPQPGWTAALVEALRRDATISFCASRMLFVDGRTVNAAGDAFDVRGRGGYNRAIHQLDGPWLDEPRIVFGACAGAALYRRSLFSDVGLFDEEFFLSWEDVDLDLRAAIAAHRCLYVPDAVVLHHRGASSGPERVWLERRNKAWVVYKNLPPPLLVLFLTLLPAREAYECLLARERPRDWLARLRPYVTDFRRARRRSRRVPRRASYGYLWRLLTADSLPYAPPPGS